MKKIMVLSLFLFGAASVAYAAGSPAAGKWYGDAPYVVDTTHPNYHHLTTLNLTCGALSGTATYDYPDLAGHPVCKDNLTLISYNDMGVSGKIWTYESVNGPGSSGQCVDGVIKVRLGGLMPITHSGDMYFQWLPAVGAAAQNAGYLDKLASFVCP